MKWFKPKYSVCKECDVHFAPAPSFDSPWGDLCPTHRKPVKERDQRKEAVMRWASANWEKLEPMMHEEYAKHQVEMNEAMQKYYNSPEVRHQMAAQQRQGLSSLGGLSVRGY